MKSNKILIFIAMIIFIGCENPDSVHETDLLKIRDQENRELSIAMDKFLKSPIFLEGLERNRKSDNKMSDKSMGAFFVQQGVFGFFPHYFESGVIVVAVLFQPGDYKIMPNGLAEFNLYTENPLVIYLDEVEGYELSANSCVERNSSFSVKYKGQVLIEETPFGVSYRAVLPLKTSYLAKGRNMLVNDAEEYDEENDLVTCREDNVTELNFDFTYIERLNNQGNATETSLNIRFR